MDQTILFRAVIEVLGKPQEHVDKALLGYVKQIEESKEFTLNSKNVAPSSKQEEVNLFAAFAELEIETPKVEHLALFCFNYMPSSIEILSPKKVTFNDRELSLFLSDLQSRLHEVDLLAKRVKVENDTIKMNMRSLMKNYLTVLLTNNKLTAKQLASLTGVDKEKLEDYLDVLIDENIIDLEGEHYIRKRGEDANKSS